MYKTLESGDPAAPPCFGLTPRRGGTGIVPRTFEPEARVFTPAQCMPTRGARTVLKGTTLSLGVWLLGPAPDSVLIWGAEQPPADVRLPATVDLVEHTAAAAREHVGTVVGGRLFPPIFRDYPVWVSFVIHDVVRQ